MTAGLVILALLESSFSSLLMLAELFQTVEGFIFLKRLFMISDLKESTCSLSRKIYKLVKNTYLKKNRSLAYHTVVFDKTYH